MEARRKVSAGEKKIVPNGGMRGQKKIKPSSGLGRLLRFEGGKILDFGCLGAASFSCISKKQRFRVKKLRLFGDFWVKNDQF